jgi:hypothetical protein
MGTRLIRFMLKAADKHRRACSCIYRLEKTAAGALVWAISANHLFKTTHGLINMVISKMMFAESQQERGNQFLGCQESRVSYYANSHMTKETYRTKRI